MLRRDRIYIQYTTRQPEDLTEMMFRKISHKWYFVGFFSPAEVREGKKGWPVGTYIYSAFLSIHFLHSISHFPSS